MGKVQSNKKIRILAIAVVTFFSLCANVLATVAWFTANRNAENDNDYFGVTNTGGSADIESVCLYQFKYGETTYGTGESALTVIDYLTPETGEVKKYDFNTSEQKFGEVVDEVFVPVTVMNIYDPVEKVIKQSNFKLKELNCNSIYEITLSTTSFTTCYLTVNASWLSTKTKLSNQIFLTDCLDFEVYFDSDLLESNPNYSRVDPETSETINKLYYPTYIEKSETLTSEEDTYYKISYLSSLSNSRPHFYGQNPKPGQISLVNNTPRQITFDSNGKFKIYVNVNYAPDQLDKYSKDIYEANIDAIYDFSLNFSLSESNS